ncbi:hypothetical protein CEXT_528241 [Caerostris extrusa]|uniref:Uncharacterized protein n=1 Tax=Caerostris extrusa TaxID=172846 RepID=A0AAV4MT21_CAEEX|nr:hypothetical protein CEXT_528241 [Caerostris extrusa]
MAVTMEVKSNCVFNFFNVSIVVRLSIFLEGIFQMVLQNALPSQAGEHHSITALRGQKSYRFVTIVTLNSCQTKRYHNVSTEHVLWDRKHKIAQLLHIKYTVQTQQTIR